MKNKAYVVLYWQSLDLKFCSIIYVTFFHKSKVTVIHDSIINEHNPLDKDTSQIQSALLDLKFSTILQKCPGTHSLRWMLTSVGDTGFRLTLWNSLNIICCGRYRQYRQSFLTLLLVNMHSKCNPKLKTNLKC